MRGMAQKLRDDEVLLGFNIMYPAEGIVERIGPDWDWVWIDGQHGQHDYRSLMACVRAADLSGIESVVRVPSQEPGWIGPVLDMGPSGIMVPQVDTREQAEAVVRAAKFPPVGNRSYGGRRPIDLYGRDYSHSANADVALVVQIESQSGVDNCEEICSVDGVDALFFGPDDMSMRDGSRMDQPRPTGTHYKVLEELYAIAKRHGVVAGGAFGNPISAAHAVSVGYRLIGAGGDVAFLANASRAQRESLREAIEEAGGSPTQGDDSPY